jgi:hypothetical protein
MSKILIVEPHKMLQKAMALCFFPDHEVKLIGNVPNSTAAIKTYDVVLIDAGALREVNALTQQTTRIVQSWATPTIWMDDNPARAPKRDKLLALKKPVGRNELISGLAKCLGTRTQARPRIVEISQSGSSAVVKAPSKGASSVNLPKKHQPIIELVDVVEKTPARKVQKRSRRKNK